MRSPLACALIAFLLAGCAGGGSSHVSGPTTLAPVRVSKWDYRGKQGRLLETTHYQIHTTIEDDEVVRNLAQLMEGAIEEYRTIAPGVQITPQPLECYLFQRRPEWAIFTKSRTGADAAVYLQINRGGYTVRDWYVAYFIGDVGTYSVAAHEGWHQFVARNFKTRPPPFLEEGLACLFEEVNWRSKLPVWDLAHNNGRRNGLRNAIDDKTLIALEQLCEMHAGMVVDRPPREVEAFYAQNWGFARFLWDGDGGKHRLALQQLLADAAAGNLFSDGGLQTAPGSTWKPKSVKPMLEHYLGMPLSDIEDAYLRYIRSVAKGAAASSSD
jgi:hypothetical protein